MMKEAQSTSESAKLLQKKGPLLCDFFKQFSSTDIPVASLPNSLRMAAGLLLPNSVKVVGAIYFMKLLTNICMCAFSRGQSGNNGVPLSWNLLAINSLTTSIGTS